MRERPAGGSAADKLLGQACTNFVWDSYVCSELNFNGRISFQSKFSPIRLTSFFGTDCSRVCSRGAGFPTSRVSPTYHRSSTAGNLSDIKVECAHSRLRGLCIAHLFSTSLMTICPPSDAPPPLPPRGFIAGPKYNPEARRTLEATFQSGVLRLIGGCDEGAV